MSAAASLYAGPLVFLSADEQRILEALVDQIVPADDAPGALQAGVVFYIDKQLAGPLKRYAETYRKSLPQFKDLLALSFEERTKYLKSVKSPFFSTLIEHTMQGFYGSPTHGGNLNDASWKMLGIEDVMGGHKH